MMLGSARASKYMPAKGSIFMISPENDMTTAIDGVRLGRDGINRRSLLRGGLAVGALGAGLAAVSAVSAKPAFAGESQVDWEWCNLCAVIYYAGNGLNNNCCAGNVTNISGTLGAHDAGSADYFLLMDESPLGYQTDWAWCNQCGELFYLPDKATSACPYAFSHALFPSTHTAGSSTSYCVGINKNPGSYDAGWNYCTMCRSLFHGSGHETGKCAGNATPNSGIDGPPLIYGSHIPNSTAYFVGIA
jgi:hypothetical protein